MRKTTFAAIAAGALILAGLRDGPTQAIARWRLRLLPRLKPKSIRSALCRPQRICPRRSLRTSRLCFRRRRQNQSTHESGVMIELTQQHRELKGIIDFADRSLDRGTQDPAQSGVSASIESQKIGTEG